MPIRPVSRRTFAKLSAAALVGSTALRAQTPPGDVALKSEVLLDLVIEAQTPSNVGAPGVGRVIVPVAGGTFNGPKLKGTIIPPGGDWIQTRPDGSSLLDVRLVLQTDDGQKIYMSWRGVSITPPGKPQYARTTPVFETSAEKYAWLNDIVSVGVYRPVPGKVGYRVYEIL